MKKLLPIVLIAILLLNVMGYYAVFLGMHYRNDKATTKLLDADIYDQDQAITIKLAISVPYMPDQHDFERVSGKFEHEGQLYRIVKQRYAQDTLTVICVKDATHEKINTLLADYVKTFTDNASDNKSTAKTASSFIKEYLPEPFRIGSMCIGWSVQVNRNTHNGTLVPTFTASIIHPPEKA